MTTRTAPVRERRSPTGLGTLPLTAVGAALAALALVATAIGLVAADGAYEAALPGLPDTGPIVGWGAPIMRVLTDLAAVLTVGWLLAATFLDPSGRDGVVSRAGRSDLRRAAVAAVV